MKKILRMGVFIVAVTPLLISISCNKNKEIITKKTKFDVNKLINKLKGKKIIFFSKEDINLKNDAIRVKIKKIIVDTYKLSENQAQNIEIINDNLIINKTIKDFKIKILNSKNILTLKIQRKSSQDETNVLNLYSRLNNQKLIIQENKRYNLNIKEDKSELISKIGTNFSLNKEEINSLVISNGLNEVNGYFSDVFIKIKFNSYEKFIILKIKTIYETFIPNNSNINNGNRGIIFQDKSGNIWTIGYDSKPQVFIRKNEKKVWQKGDETNLTKNINIKESSGATIFQDKNGNIWSTGYKSKLQVLMKGEEEKGWQSETKSGLTKNSNIIGGQWAKIFQDKNGNIWSMGYDTKLQVLEHGKENEGWKDDLKFGLTKNSNINNGLIGNIFQDNIGNIWSMGYDTKLQVLERGKENEGWKHNHDSGLTKNSNITTGYKSTIFEDKYGNIWSMGYNSPLQILEHGKEKEGWKHNRDSGLTKNSNIIDGFKGEIFQDNIGNIWSMGKNTPLQVLESGKYHEGWKHSIKHGLTKNSNISKGNGGSIFQDKNGNIWSMGKNTSLQVLESGKYNEGWKHSLKHGLTKNSNISDGNNGIIFQDDQENIWAMSMNSRLQVLEKNSNIWKIL